MKVLIDYLNKHQIAYELEVDLSNITFGKVGGICENIIYPKSSEQIKSLINFLNKKNIMFTIIGETSNMLFLDDVKYGVLLSTKLMNKIEFSKDYKSVFVESGCNLGFFLRKLYSMKMKGFDGLEGIPGSVGGAIFMNAGAYGYETSTFISRVVCIDTVTGDLVEFKRKDCNFKQRSSLFREKRNLLIVAAEFQLSKDKSIDYLERIANFHTARNCYQEYVLPNMGSVFTAKRCVYEELANVDWKYKIKKALWMRLYHNRWSRFLYLRNPNRKKLNDMTIKHFDLQSVSKVISSKHINMFANKNATSWDMIDYIFRMQEILQEKVELENEIVRDNIIKVVNEEIVLKYRDKLELKLCNNE